MKRLLGINVFEAAQQRINYSFDNFEKVYLSFSGGKDSSVMFHLTMMEAKKRNKKVRLYAYSHFTLRFKCVYYGIPQISPDPNAHQSNSRT